MHTESMGAVGVVQGRFSFPWWVTLVQGIFSLIIGLLLLTHPLATMIGIVEFIGIYWLITGVISISGIGMDNRMWGWKLVSGVVGIIAGMAVIQHPLWSSILLPEILVIFLGINGVIIGLVNCFAAFKGGGMSVAVVGVVSLLFGTFLLSSPVAAALAVPLAYGIISLLGGLVAIVVAFRQRRIEKGAQD